MSSRGGGSMRWADIARKDFQYARRSKVFIAVAVIFALLALVVVALPGVLALLVDEPIENQTVREALFPATASAAWFIVPITSLVAAYLSVVGERESGRLRLLLSMPPTRRDVIVGKFVSRCALITVALTSAYALVMVVSLLLYQTLPLEIVLWTVLLTAIMGICYVGIAVGVSAATDSRMKAIVGVLMVFIISVVLWGPLLQAVFLMNGFVEFMDADSMRNMLGFLDVLSPVVAYSELYDNLNPPGAFGGGATWDSTDFFQNNPFLLLILVLWTAVPVMIGYFLFERDDLS